MKNAAPVASALALVFVCILQLLAMWRLAHRPGLDVDESEFLHASLRMARGERIYLDFAEHHPPFLFHLLSRMAPRDTNDRPALDAWVLRARLLSALFGAVAVAAVAFVIVRATGMLYAPAIFIGTLLASPALWSRAFADVRTEPAALALFCAGAALVLLDSRRITLAAIGAGMIALGCLINPKWPLSSVALGIIFLVAAVRAGRAAFLRGVAMALAMMAAIALLLVSTIDPRLYVDFVFVQSRHLFWWLSHRPEVVTITPFFHCPPLLQPLYVFPAAAIVLAAAIATRDSFRDVRIVYGVIALVVTTFLEIRFVYAYPMLFVQYYILWGIAAAAAYAFLPAAVAGLLAKGVPNVAPVARVVPVVLTILAIVAAVAALPAAGVPDPNVVANAALAARLRPGDTVFLGMRRHPLGAHDASYYWFGFGDFVPSAIDLAKTPAGARFLPPIREEDLPPCRLERGLEPHLRLVTGGDEVAPMPVVSGCIDRLRVRGVLLPTHTKDVYYVRP